MPKYHTLHVVKTVHVCRVSLTLKNLHYNHFISQRAELKMSVSSFSQRRWCSDCGGQHESAHEHPARLQPDEMQWLWWAVWIRARASCQTSAGVSQMGRKNSHRVLSGQHHIFFRLASWQGRVDTVHSRAARALLWFWKSAWSLRNGHLFHAAILSRIWSTRRERSLKDGRWFTVLFQHSVMIT